MGCALCPVGSCLWLIPLPLSNHYLFKRSQWPKKLRRYDNHTYVHTHALPTPFSNISSPCQTHLFSIALLLCGLRSGCCTHCSRCRACCQCRVCLFNAIVFVVTEPRRGCGRGAVRTVRGISETCGALASNNTKGEGKLNIFFVGSMLLYLNEEVKSINCFLTFAVRRYRIHI